MPVTLAASATCKLTSIQQQQRLYFHQSSHASGAQHPILVSRLSQLHHNR
jgi:hypothetical protein